MNQGDFACEVFSINCFQKVIIRRQIMSHDKTERIHAYCNCKVIQILESNHVISYNFSDYSSSS